MEAARHKREVEEQRAQRIRAKEAKKVVIQSKKRSLEEDEVDQPRKRMRTTASRIRNTGNSHASSIEPHIRTVPQSTRTISDIERGVICYGYPGMA